MFTQKWRQHWGLTGDPFACEDADKDVVLEQVDSAAVHSGFDRIYGNPEVPAPGIVFGEKGSGKSGLRRMMGRRLAEHNAAGRGRVFVVEYIDFDLALEHFREAIGAATRDNEKAAGQVIERWTIADHLDGILSLGVTELSEAIIEQRESARELAKKQKVDLTVLAALYYGSQLRTQSEALRRLRRRLGMGSWYPFCKWLVTLSIAALGIFVGLQPQLGLIETESPNGWYTGGAILLALAVLGRAWSRLLVRTQARRSRRSLRILPHDPAPLASVLSLLRPKDRGEFGLPHSSDDATRYDLLHRFLGLLEALGYHGCYVLMDRVDEPSLLSGNEGRMLRFVESILDIKLLQYPRLALKLFLPIEMESLYRNASPEALKRMRLDKSNLVPELKWTGEELYEIADQRLKACQAGESSLKGLWDLFEEGFDQDYLRQTLTILGTPRYAFGFLSSAFSEHVRELPAELEPGDPAWRLPRTHFDIVRGAWIDRAALMRRSLN